MALALYGKHPARGDLIETGLPPAMLKSLESWLDSALGECRTALGMAWEQAWAQAPVLRFWLGEDILGQAACGVMTSAQDRVGRRFPLVILWTDPVATNVPPPPVIHGDQGWYDHAEAHLRAVLTWPSMERTESLLEGLSGPREGDGLPGDSNFWAESGGGAVALLADVALADHRRAATGRSYWWTHFAPAPVEMAPMPEDIGDAFALEDDGFGVAPALTAFDDDSDTDLEARLPNPLPGSGTPEPEADPEEEDPAPEAEEISEDADTVEDDADEDQDDDASAPPDDEDEDDAGDKAEEADTSDEDEDEEAEDADADADAAEGEHAEALPDADDSEEAPAEETDDDDKEDGADSADDDAEEDETSDPEADDEDSAAEEDVEDGQDEDDAWAITEDQSPFDTPAPAGSESSFAARAESSGDTGWISTAAWLDPDLPEDDPGPEMTAPPPTAPEPVRAPVAPAAPQRNSRFHGGDGLPGGQVLAWFLS
jgi:type VI secretion system protein ImpM